MSNAKQTKYNRRRRATFRTDDQTRDRCKILAAWWRVDLNKVATIAAMRGLDELELRLSLTPDWRPKNLGYSERRRSLLEGKKRARRRRLREQLRLERQWKNSA
jgi:hypothetical protein